MNLKEIRTSIVGHKGRRAEAKQTILATQTTVDKLTKEIKRSEKAQAIIQLVAQQTQKELEYHISDIVTLALDTVFDEEYKFKIEFVIKRNKTECNLVFEKDGETMNPMEDDAGGAVDVASFALRIALWTLQAPRSRNTIILDESFKFVSKNLLPRVGELLQELSKRLNLQFILVTHLEELEEWADKIFKVRIKKGVSGVEEEN